MPTLPNSKHEHFAELVAKGVSATKAYVAAGYSANGARQSSARMVSTAVIRSRVRELQETFSAGVVEAEISRRNDRVMVLQKRWERLRSALDELLDQRAADMAGIPGGSSGLLLKYYKGDQLVTRIDPGVIALAQELRAIEKQAAEELSQWKAPVEETKITLDATPEAVGLALVMSREELEALQAKLLAARAATE
jgi:hypothetical protein